MADIPLSSLISIATKEEIYQAGLEVATDLGLQVTSWRVDDPTRANFHFLAEILATRDQIASDYVAAGFLPYAAGDWLTVVAKQVYGVDRIEGSAASGSGLTLSNSTGAVYSFDPGDLTFSSSTSNKTYHNTTGGTLGASGTLDVAFVADEVGSDSTAATDEIDTVVSGPLGVTITSSPAVIGVDEESDEDLRARCLNSLGALSPAGPADAYRYVATTSSLTGNSETTKAKATHNSTTGDVTLYLAGPNGAVTAGAVTAVDDAIATWATPLCVTVTTQAAAEVNVTITATLSVLSSVGDAEATIQANVQAALSELFALVPIGGYNGELATSLIIAAIKAVYPDHIFKVVLSSPAANVALTAGQVAKIDGTPTINVNFFAS